MQIRIGFGGMAKGNGIIKGSTRVPPRSRKSCLGSGANAGEKEAKEAKEARLQEILAELDKLIGLKNIKELVKEICAYVKIQQKRRLEGLVAGPVVLHMIFKGNPGTGKSTVARIMGRLFKELGVLSSGHLNEIERADLVGEYIGHTAQRAREQLRKSMGGILFIDEAYSLARGGEKDFGREAIDVLVKGMEDYRDNLILILAGYKEEMEYFLEANPGLRSRFPIHLDFPDYTITELIEIAQLMLKDRQYQLTPGALQELEKILRRDVIFGHCYSGNARMVRNIIERAVRRQAVRLVEKADITRDDLLTITREDLIQAGLDAHKPLSIKIARPEISLPENLHICYNNHR